MVCSGCTRHPACRQVGVTALARLVNVGGQALGVTHPVAVGLDDAFVLDLGIPAGALEGEGFDQRLNYLVQTIL